MPYHRLGAENYLPHRETDYSAATRNADINVTAVLATLMVHWFVLKDPGSITFSRPSNLADICDFSHSVLENSA